MAELVDALASEASKLMFVEVQVLLSPPTIQMILHLLLSSLCFIYE